jgi:hypothetical protein
MMRTPNDPSLRDDPAEGRSDLPLPGADHGDAEDPESADRDRLADRVGAGSPPVAATQEPDVLPDVEVPDATM